jgi:integrase
MDEFSSVQVEFCELYKKRLYKCLTKDKLYEELLLCTTSVDLGLRQNELLMLTWEQIDFNNKVIKDVKISKKRYPEQETLDSYGDLHMTDDIYDALKLYESNCEHDKGKLFRTSNRLTYCENIRKSIGDSNFRMINLRNIYITLKVAELGE